MPISRRTTPPTFSPPRNGETYLVERERVEDTTFADRNPGRMVGPFSSPEAAEKFIVATPWFCGPPDEDGSALARVPDPQFR